LFLQLNGVLISFQPAVHTVLALAAGELSKEKLADWFRQRLGET
jgi:prophage maintenance system killer protein